MSTEQHIVIVQDGYRFGGYQTYFAKRFIRDAQEMAEHGWRIAFFSDDTVRRTAKIVFEREGRAFGTKTEVVGDNIATLFSIPPPEPSHRQNHPTATTTP